MSLLDVMKKAEEEGEAFIASLTPEQLRSTGFEGEKDFWNFEFVNIFLLFDGEFKLKYIFNNDQRNVLYEREEEVGGPGVLLGIVQQYLDLGFRENR